QRGAPRHQAIGSVARRRVGDHADDPAVDEAFLLGEIGAKGQADFARAGLDRGERGADQRHGFLPGKTFANVVHGEPAKLLDVYVNVNWAYTAPMELEERERSEYSIGDLSREFDVTPRAIRFYEDQGLISPRRDGQRRIYTPRDRTRLKLTLRGKRLGLSLSEIRELIDMYEPGRDERPQLERFLSVLETHKASLLRQRADVEAQLSELQAFEKRVRKQLKS